MPHGFAGLAHESEIEPGDLVDDRPDSVWAAPCPVATRADLASVRVHADNSGSQQGARLGNIPP